MVHGPVRPAAAAGGVGLGASAGRQLLLAVDGTDDSYAAVRWLLQHVHRAGAVGCDVVGLRQRLLSASVDTWPKRPEHLGA